MKETNQPVLNKYLNDFMAYALKIVIIGAVPFLYSFCALSVETPNLPEFKSKFYEKADLHRIRSVKDQQYKAYQQRMAMLGTKVSNDTGVVSRFTSGTGFFIDYHHIVTNEHVVQECQHIRIRGAVQPSYAQLIAVDKDSDLAILRTTRSPLRPASLRGNKSINIGEKVSVIGYPLENGVTGKYILKNAHITNVDNDDNSSNRIQFTDSVEKGNSGGPLIDGSGTVIGVIVGKMNYYLNNTGSTKHAAKPIKTSSVAISLATLKNFLNKFNILYYTDDVNTAYTSDYMEEKAQEYVVNIHCVKTPTRDAGADPKFPYRVVASTSSE